MSKIKIINILFLILILIGITFLFNTRNTQSTSKAAPKNTSPSPTINPPPDKKILKNDYYITQTFNNCGPASLSMALSYFNIQKSQEELGLILRPYQNDFGDNDDKSVTLEEMAKKAEDFDLTAYHRPGGSIELLKKFIAQDIPVITRTWLNLDEDIGHYRIIKGYDNATRTIYQDDSYQGNNLEYSFEDFKQLWKKFNYEFLVLVTDDKKDVALKILGENARPENAWEKAAQDTQKQLESDPEDIYTRFNLAVAYYKIGDYKKSIEEYEKVEYQLPWRTLWYQIEPIEAYYKTGNYDKVFLLTDAILNNENRAFSELYILRGKIYQKQGNTELAEEELEKAKIYKSTLN